MDTKSHAESSAAELPAFDVQSGELNAVIDAPKGSRNKYKFDEQRRLYRLSGVLPAGAVFPFDFGFVPSTVGGDGDPLDVLILMDEAAFTGCVVPSRLVGVLEASQREGGGKSEDNHRLIAVATASHQFREVERLEQIGKNVVDEIEHFFVSYNTIKGKRFEVHRRSGPDRARKIVNDAIKHTKEGKRDGHVEAHQEPAAPHHAHVASHPERAPRTAAKPSPPASKPQRGRGTSEEGYSKRFGGPR